ncbi:18900_t:CDS:2, partial [Gigaspora rosea]
KEEHFEYEASNKNEYKEEELEERIYNYFELEKEKDLKCHLKPTIISYLQRTISSTPLMTLSTSYLDLLVSKEKFKINNINSSNILSNYKQRENISENLWLVTLLLMQSYLGNKIQEYQYSENDSNTNTDIDEII